MSPSVPPCIVCGLDPRDHYDEPACERYQPPPLPLPHRVVYRLGTVVGVVVAQIVYPEAS